MRLFIWRKGGPGSGWYAPGKGTHTGEKHRAVGSGKAGGVAGKKPEKKRLEVHTGDRASQMSATKSGNKGYLIREDGMLLDAALGQKGTVSHEDFIGSVIAEGDPSILGLDPNNKAVKRLGKIVTEMNAAQRAGDLAKAGALTDDYFDAMTSIWSQLNKVRTVRVGESGPIGKHLAFVGGLPPTRASVGRLQDWVLSGKLNPAKSSVYRVEWTNGEWSEFSWEDLMAAKYPRDLKDMMVAYPKIVIRLLAPI